MNVELETPSGLSAGNSGSAQQTLNSILPANPGGTYTSYAEERRKCAEAVSKLQPFFPGSTFKVDGDDNIHGLRLDGGRGERVLYVAYESRGHRLCISGGWPYKDGVGTYSPGERDRKETGYLGSIHVSAKKSAEQVAADIKRRWLNHYSAAFAICLARRDSDIAYAQKTTDFAAELGAIMGTRADEKSAALPEPFGGEFACHGDKAELKIHYLSREQARAFAAFITTIAGEATREEGDK